MNSATMTIKIDNRFNDTSNNDDEDALSLRDLQLYDQTASSSTRSSPRASSGEDLFEFLPTLPSPTATGDVVFCGKVISSSVDKFDDENLNDQYQNHNFRSSSFRLPDRPIKHVIPTRSVSNRDLGSPRHGVKLSTSDKKVNVAAMPSMTSRSKRRMFMLGPVKFMPEMEMRSLRERQQRRTPSRMFPVSDGGDVAKKAVAGTDKNERVRCRARLNSVLERSLACLRI